MLWFRIVEASKAILEVVNYQQAVYQFSVTALRNIIGQTSLDEVLKDREKINQTLQEMVGATTEPWGIKIEMVEMKDVEIPESMQRAMAREAEAIREKRARIVKAEAELEASIKLTQGAKQMEASKITRPLSCCCRPNSARRPAASPENSRDSNPGRQFDDSPTVR